VSYEKVGSEPKLQIFDMLTDDAVADVQFACRSGKTGMPCSSLEDPERIKVTKRISHGLSVGKSFAERKLNALSGLGI